METPATTPPITGQIQEYLKTRFELLKLEGIDKASEIVAEVLTDLVIALSAVLTFILLSITLALFAAHLLNSYWLGFACTTGFYLLITIAARLLKINLRNLFIRVFIKKVFRFKQIKSSNKN